MKSTEHLVVLTGAELAVDPVGLGRYTEILAIGIDEVPEDPGGDRRHWDPHENEEHYTFKTFPDLSTAGVAIGAQGGVSYIAHPYWSGLPPEALTGARGVTGVELFNSSAERENRRGDSSYVWDLALEAGSPLFAIATDDCHYPGFDIGDAWTMVRAAERSPEAVMAALRDGLTYASSGPVLYDVFRDDAAIEVRCSPCASATLMSGAELGWGVVAGPRGRQEALRVLERDDDGLIVRVRFEPPEQDLSYIRVVVTDGSGRSAWTNPI